MKKRLICIVLIALILSVCVGNVLAAQTTYATKSVRMPTLGGNVDWQVHSKTTANTTRDFFKWDSATGTGQLGNANAINVWVITNPGVFSTTTVAPKVNFATALRDDGKYHPIPYTNGLTFSIGGEATMRVEQNNWNFKWVRGTARFS
ncbi:MAG: hypothetical protein LBC71_04040 [Oscillospiraceae bacterium]|jgi:hypothetical protein|nr:hypothetical protein [Oscillospiraceae bacterium]